VKFHAPSGPGAPTRTHRRIGAGLGQDPPSIGGNGDGTREGSGGDRCGDDWALAAVYDGHYVRPFRDAEEREKVRESLASIGFGNGLVDQTR
jgi:hypothetical protein